MHLRNVPGSGQIHKGRKHNGSFQGLRREELGVPFNGSRGAVLQDRKASGDGWW